MSDGAGVGAKSSYGKSGGSVYERREAVLIRNVQNESHERPESISNTNGPGMQQHYCGIFCIRKHLPPEPTVGLVNLFESACPNFP